jgi:DNA-directed RNA polymerase subunit RPC12/RpoP
MSIAMRAVQAGEVPPDGGTAIQEDPAVPVFRGTAGDDYVCVQCGNVLATNMAPEYINRKLRIKCGICRTVNVGIEVPGVDYRKAFGNNPRG